MADIRDQTGSWPVTESSVLARGRIVTVREDRVRLPDGEVVGRELVEHPGAVAVVALDELDRVLLIRQYRHPVAATLWEIPAGLRDVHGEALVETARRELAEETGLAAGSLRLLGVYDTPGRDPRGWTVSIAYLATVCAEAPVKGADDARDARWFPTEDLPELAFDHAAIIDDALQRRAECKR